MCIKSMEQKEIMQYYNLPSIANPANERLDFEVGWLVEIMRMNMKLESWPEPNSNKKMLQ